MSRTEGSHIKDLEYNKYYVIYYRHREDSYVLCRPENGQRITFVALNTVPITELSSCGVIKFDTELEALLKMDDIPYFEINGYAVDLEVTSNVFKEFLIGV